MLLRLLIASKLHICVSACRRCLRIDLDLLSALSSYFIFDSNETDCWTHMASSTGVSGVRSGIRCMGMQRKGGRLTHLRGHDMHARMSDDAGKNAPVISSRLIITAHACSASPWMSFSFLSCF